MALRPHQIGLFPHLFPHHRPGPGAPSQRPWAVTAMVAGGGAAGAAARVALARWTPDSVPGFPATTLWVNLSGCFAMGVLMGVLHCRTHPSLWAGPVLGSGFLGGFTTFSSFSGGVRALLAAGRYATAASYAAATVVGGIAAAAVAYAFVEHLTRRPRE
ncbi:fluoride efflux transporter FluC [Uniformispora flossi]|uniref:fluoride efflux transporter FluC n=1 Tax=Uniformispora flossi TaxID=3390723 RepID=UPI003C2B3730